MTQPSLDPVLRRVDELLDLIDRKIREFVDTVNDFLAWVPGFMGDIADLVRRSAEQAVSATADAARRVRTLLDQTGDPRRLADVAVAWANDVANPLTALDDLLSPTKLQADKRWDGYAAEMYVAAATEQREALTALRDLAGQIQTSLQSVSHAVIAFWVAVAIALIEFALALCAGIAAAASGVGAPAGAAAIVAGATHVAALLGVALVGATAVCLEQERQQSAIVQKLSDLGPDWPRPPVGELSDASRADGDGSDWIPSR